MFSRLHGFRTQRMARTGLGLVSAACLAVVAAGCSGSQDPASNGSGDGYSQSADTSVLNAAWEDLGPMDYAPGSDNNGTLDPRFWVQETLTEVDPESGEIVGRLAESFSLSDDLRTWTFKLRPGVPFHDDYGTVTADDVKHSWERRINENSSWADRTQMALAVDGNMDNFEIVSDTEFKLHTTTPIVHLPAVLSASIPGMGIIPKKYYEENPEQANSHPIGTGPWKFVSATPGNEVVLEAVPDHWRSTPSFERLVVKEIPDPAARLVQVQSGAIDIALLDTALVQEAEAANLRTISVPDVGTSDMILGGSYWGVDGLDEDAPWIQADEPEKGRAIREAMSLAIDRDVIIERLRFGNGTRTYAPTFQYANDPLRMDSSWKLPEYNLDLAKQKLAEGGYPDGFPITVMVHSQGLGEEVMNEAVAGMWEELGLDVTREQTEESLLRPLQSARTTDGLAWVHTQSQRIDPALTLANYDSSRTDGFRLTYGHPAIQDGLQRVLVEPDFRKRWNIGVEVLDALRADVVALPLFSIDMPFVVGSKVGSWTPLAGVKDFTELDTVRPPG